MRCKRHTVDFSSSIGVCASCLRERLFSLAASAAATAAVEESRKSNKNPPFLILPRSVSPYKTRRKSNNPPLTSSNRRFIALPQVDFGYSNKDFESNRILKSKEGKFSNLFRTRSEEFDSNRRFSCDASESSSRSCVSTIISVGRRKKQQTTACCVEQELPSETMEESPGRIRIPPATKAPGRRKVATGLGKNFCLNPLVRANPNCSQQRKIGFSSEFGNSGKIVKSEKSHISAATSFCTNRSRKLVDLGRVDRRR